MSDFDGFVQIDKIPTDQPNAVYKAENARTGQFYIGASGQLRKRIGSHIRSLMHNDHNCRGGTDLFQKAYNWDQDFEFTALSVPTRDEAFVLERELIEKHRGNPLCLNMKYAIPNAPASEETRAKLSESSKKMWQDPDYRKRVTESVQIASRSESRRKQVSEHTKSMWENPEHRAKMETHLRSPEFKALISSVSSGRVDSEETRLKKSFSKKGIPQSPELVEKRAAALRGRVKTAEEIQACSAGFQAKMASMTDAEKAQRLERMAENSRLGAERTKRAVVIDGVSYDSVSAALKAIGGSSATLYKKLKAQGYEVRT